MNKEFSLCHDTVMHAIAWRRKQTGTFSALLALCEGNSPVTGGYPSQRPVPRVSKVFFDLRLNKTVKQTIETPVIWDAIAPIVTSCNVIFHVSAMVVICDYLYARDIEREMYPDITVTAE